MTRQSHRLQVLGIPECREHGESYTHSVDVHGFPDRASFLSKNSTFAALNYFHARWPPEI